MYRRRYGRTTYTFEPSGGVLWAGLVMQDLETDSYWSLIEGRAIAGPARGRRLEEIPGAEKTTWASWKARHPDSQVLSLATKEHLRNVAYDDYWASSEGFGGLEASDERLATRASIYAFHWQGNTNAVAHDGLTGGAVVVIDAETEIFLYRAPDDDVLQSTAAFVPSADVRVVRQAKGGWTLRAGGENVGRFDPAARTFDADPRWFRTFVGYDTYWYIWSLTHPETRLLDAAGPGSPSGVFSG